MNNFFNTTSNNLHLIYPDIKLVTITCYCTLNNKLNLANIFNYIELSYYDILAIKYNGQMKVIQNTIKKKKNLFKNFNNQITMTVKLYKDKEVSLKLFETGSLQVTGCKNAHDFNILFNILINRLNKKIYILDTKTNKMEFKPFFQGSFITLQTFSYKMINSKFSINNEINREQLHTLLVENNINCRYESAIRTSVDIEHRIGDRKISIFIFSTGKMLITGAIDGKEINSCYDFIIAFIKKYKDLIILKNYKPLLNRYLLQLKA